MSDGAQSDGASPDAFDDDNGTLETADEMPMPNGFPLVEADLEPPSSDVDYFWFDAAAGLALIIVENAPELGPAGYLDTVITIYDSNGTQVARNHDEFYPGFGTESTVDMVFPAAGRYYIRVEEWCATAEGQATPDCAAPYFETITDTHFALGVMAADPLEEGVVPEATEPNDTIGTAANMEYAPDGFGTYYASVAFGEWGTTGDVDAIRFDVPPDLLLGPGTRVNGSFMFWPSGSAGNGSTVKTGIVEITDIASGDVLSRLDFAGASEERNERTIMSAPLELAGSYLIRMSDGPAAVGGISPSYVVWHTVREGNPLEAQEPGNNVISTPEMLGASGNSYFLDADLPPGDVDHFRIDVLGASLAIRCGGASAGSGATLRATAFSGDGVTQLGSGTEPSPPTSDLSLLVDTSGQTSVIVKLEKTMQSAEIVGTWYRCGFHFQ